MDIENRSMRMLLQSMPKKGFALTFLLFILALVICIIIGAVGPKVYHTRETNSWGENCASVEVYDDYFCEGVDIGENGTIWTGEIKNLDKLNQELSLTAKLTNEEYKKNGVSKNVRFQLSISGRNNDDDKWHTILKDDHHDRELTCYEGEFYCEDISLAHQVFIQYKTYQYNVSLLTPPVTMGDVIFTFQYVNSNYTLFELWWRFVFLILTFAVVVAYTFKLRRYNWHDWTVEQRWATFLLFGLMGYNNPIYPMEILVDGWFPIFINRLLYISFIVLLLFFWLTMFDAIRLESSKRPFLTFYLPKYVLMGLIWISGIAVFVWDQLHLLDNPAYTTSEDMAGFWFFRIVMIAMVGIYALWLMVVIARGISDARTLPYLGVRIKFFLVFTILVIIVICFGIWFGAFQSQNNAAEFLSFIALLNLYCWVLAFVYLPARGSEYTAANRVDKIGMVRLEEDEA